MQTRRKLKMAFAFGLLMLLFTPHAVHAVEETVNVVSAPRTSDWTWAPEHGKVVALNRSDLTLSIFSFAGKEVFQKSVRKYCDQVEMVGDSIVVGFHVPRSSFPSRSSSGRTFGGGGRRPSPKKDEKEQEPDGFHIIPIDDPDNLKTVKVDRSIGDFFLNPKKKDRIHFLHSNRRNRFIGTMLLGSGKVTWEQFEGEDKNRRKILKKAPFISMGPLGPVAATSASQLPPLKSVEPLVMALDKRSRGGLGGGLVNRRNAKYISGDGRFMSTGTAIFDNQSTEELFQFPETKSPDGSKPASFGGRGSKAVRGPVAFHQNYDLIAYAAYDKLKFFSLSNRRLIRSWILSDHKPPKNRPLKFPQTVRVDGDRAFVAYGDCAFVIEFKEAFDEGLAKRTRLPLIRPQVLSSGTPFEWDLKKFADGKPKFKLKDQPEGMRVQNGVVRWTPRVDQSGLFTATIVMTVDGKTDRADVNFVVQPRYCEIGFLPDGVRFDRTGDRLVCWAGRSIAIVDTRKLKVMSATRLGAKVKAATLEKNHCYVRVEDSLALNRFDARNLQKEPLRIQETDESKLASISLFAKNGLEPRHERIAEEYWSDFSTVRTLRNDKLVGIVDAGDLPVIPKKDSVGRHNMNMRRISTLSNLSRFDIRHSLYPWEVVGRTTEKGSTRTIDSWLEFRSTLPTGVGVPVPDKKIWLGNFPRGDSDKTKMFHLSNRLVTFYRDKVFTIDVPKHDGPAKFELGWPEFQPLSADKNVELKIPTIGGSGRFRFAMKHSIVGLTLNPNDGTLRVEGPGLWEANLRSFEEHQNLIAVSKRGDRLHEWKRQFLKRYEALTGFRLPKGKLPALVPVWIVATDETGQRDEIRFYLLMHGDPVAQPEAVSKKMRDKIDRDQRKAVQLQRRLESVEQSFDASIRSLSIIETLLQQKLERLKSEKEGREEAGQTKTD